MKSRIMTREAYVARIGETRGVCRVLVGKPGRKSPPEKPRRRWEDKCSDRSLISGTGIHGPA